MSSAPWTISLSGIGKAGMSAHNDRYGYAHRKMRRQVEKVVEAGNAVCSRCAYPIVPGEPWDLDHDDHGARTYRGPSHARCNRAVAGNGIASPFATRTIVRCICDPAKVDGLKGAGRKTSCRLHSRTW